MAIRIFGAPQAIERLKESRTAIADKDASAAPPMTAAPATTGEPSPDDGMVPMSAPEGPADASVTVPTPNGVPDGMMAVDLVAAEKGRTTRLAFPIGQAAEPAGGTALVDPRSLSALLSDLREEADERFPPEYFDVSDEGRRALRLLRSTSPVSLDVGITGLSPERAAPEGPPGPAMVARRALALREARAGLGGGGDGRDVGVVVVDEGVSADYVRKLAGREAFGGGWQLLGADGQNATARVGRFADPYRRACDGHGNMVARNVLSLAPRATIYDAPVLPPRVTDIERFSSGATAVLLAVLVTLLDPARYGLPRHERWIVVNAWGVANSFADPFARAGGPHGYVRNRDHMLNGTVRALASLSHVDVVFAAGNNGEHAPALHSGAYDRGPHRSIWGANGLSEVDTVGARAVATGHAVAASSQEPCMPEMQADPAEPKRLHWMPSWFAEDDDASILNTGTSAAAALHAGVLACRHSAPVVG